MLNKFKKNIVSKILVLTLLLSTGAQSLAIKVEAAESPDFEIEVGETIKLSIEYNALDAFFRIDSPNNSASIEKTGSSIVQIGSFVRATYYADVKGISPGLSTLYLYNKNGTLVTSATIMTIRRATDINTNLNSPLYLSKDEVFEIESNVVPTDATNQEITWSVLSGEGIVDLNETTITAVEYGKSTLQASAENGEVVRQYDVYVVNKTTDISLEKQKIELINGENYQVNYEILPTDATIKDVTWDVENNAILSIDELGFITTLKAGTTKVVAKTIDGGAAESFIVNVLEPVTGVELNKESLTLEIDQEEQLIHTIIPNDVHNKNVSWHSDNEAVAIVDETGKVKGIKEGVANISVTTEDGDFVATSKVLVAILVEDIEVNTTDLNLIIGETKKIEATITPIEATNKAINWTSSDDSIATVVDGEVEAVSPGIATITAETVDGKHAAETVVTVSNSVTKITLESIPSKTIYSVGEKLNLSEGRIKVDYINGEHEILDLKLDMVKDFDNSGKKLGKQQLTVTFEDHTTHFDIYMNKFKDVKVGSSFYDYIYDLHNDDIIKGYDEDSTFKPNNNLTRAQAAKMIVESAGINTDGVKSNFKDVKKDKSQYTYISALVEAGIVKGYDDGTFRPNAPVTRAQIAKMVTLAFELEEKGTPNKFVDVEKIDSKDTRDYIYILSSNDIVKGYGNEFRPRNNVTRGQFSKIVSIARDPEKYE